MSDYEHDGNIFTGIEDELREHREYEKNYYSGGGGGKEPQGCGCLSTFIVARCACYGVVVGGKDIFLRQSGAASPPA